jgi:hypothetical protein
VKKLLIKHGATGYAIYFHCLELIAAETSESNLTFELEHDSEIIADNLHIKGTAEKSGIAIVEEIMRFIVELDLFQEAEGHVFCFKLLKRLDLSMTSNPKFRELITKSKENHDGVMIVSCKPSSLQAFKPNEQDKQTEPCFVSILDTPIQNGCTRIETARKAWNESKAGPECRLMAITLPPQDREDCLRVMTAYSDADVVEAICNYKNIRESPEHEVSAPYRSFAGFMRGGVEKFVSTADPFTAYKKRVSGFENAEERARREADEYFKRSEK